MGCWRGLSLAQREGATPPLLPGTLPRCQSRSWGGNDLYLKFKNHRREGVQAVMEE